MARVRLGLYVGEGLKIGPGKVRLLEAIDREGSISAAARTMKMGYRHAWEMVNDLNASFREPVVRPLAGGRSGGGATLTELGREIIERFRAMEAKALRAVDADARALEARTRTPARSRR